MRGTRSTVKALLLGLVVCTASVMVAGCGGPQESAQQYLSRAQKDLAKGDDQAAEIEIKNALQKNSENGEARYLLGVIHNDRGQGSAAEIELRKALRLGVDRDKVGAALGRALVLQRKYHKALDELKPFDAVQGKLGAAIYTERGNAYFALGKPKQAGSAYGEAVKRDPEFANAYIGRARVAAAQSDVAQALKEVTVALSKSPKSSEGWILKGDILRLQSKPDQARAAYKRVIQIDNRNIQARFRLISMDLQGHKLDAAKAELQAVKKIAPKNLLVKYLGAVLAYRDGKTKEARDKLQDVMAAAPNYMPGVLLSGAIAYKLGDYEQAYASAGRFVGQFPNNSYAIKLLAATNLKLKQPKAALKVLAPLLSKTPVDTGALALAAEASMQAKQYAQASGYLQAAASAAPKSVRLRTELAVSRLAQGETERAVSDLEDATKLSSANAEPDALLAVTYLTKREYGKALRAAQAWRKKQPQNPVAYNVEGGAYLGQENLARARESFEHALKIKADYFPAAMNLARLDMREKRPADAGRHLKGVLAGHKDYLPAMLALANLAAVTGDDAQTLEWLNKAIKAHPTAMEPRRFLVRYYLHKKDPKGALAAAEAAEAANPQNPSALSLLGATQLATGDRKAGVATYGELTSAAPKSAAAFFQLGLAQIAAGDTTGARVSITKALKIHPRYLIAELALISLDAKAGKYGEGMDRARTIQKQYPKLPAGHMVQGDLWMAQHAYDRAVASYEQAFKIRPTSVTFTKVHQALMRAGKKERAAHFAARWLRQHPKDSGVRIYLANAYEGVGQTAKAIGAYEAILKYDPHNVVALNNLALLYDKENNRRALPMAEQAHKAAPGNPEITDTLGWILVRRGATQRGLELLRKASASAPGVAGIQYHFAYALARTGHKDEARRRLEALQNSADSSARKDAAKLLEQLKSGSVH